MYVNAHKLFFRNVSNSSTLLYAVSDLNSKLKKGVVDNFLWKLISLNRLINSNEMYFFVPVVQITANIHKFWCFLISTNRNFRRYFWHYIQRRENNIEYILLSFIEFNISASHGSWQLSSYYRSRNFTFASLRNFPFEHYY